MGSIAEETTSSDTSSALMPWLRTTTPRDLGEPAPRLQHDVGFEGSLEKRIVMRPDREFAVVVRFEGYDVLGVARAVGTTSPSTADGVASVEAQALFNIRQWPFVEELTSVNERPRYR